MCVVTSSKFSNKSLVLEQFHVFKSTRAEVAVLCKFHKEVFFIEWGISLGH